jgi:MFS family permease
VVCGALFLDGLDLSMVGVALPSIGHDLALPAGRLQWIVSGYVLGYGGFLLLGGRVSDVLGRRGVFLSAVALFGVASVVSAAMSNDVALIALRFVKGASAGFTVPAGLSIVTTTFAEGPARSRALGIYAACGASGFSLGLVSGGLLTEVGWRATLFAPGPVALVLLAAGLRVVPRSTRDRVTLSSFDLAGAFTSTASLLLFVYAVVEAPRRGWGSAGTVLTLALSVALMAVFVLVERRHAHPLVRLGILRSAALLHANLAAGVLVGGFISFQFVVTLYVQNSLGWSPIHMALAFLPGSAIMAIFAPRMGGLMGRHGTAPLVLGGLSAMLLAYVLVLRAQPSMSYAEFLLPTMVLVGVGFALAFPAINVQATAGVADHEQGLASGLVNTSMQIGGAIILAVVTAVLGGSDATARPGALLPHMTTAIGFVAGVAVVGVLVSAVRVAVGRRREPPTTAPVDAVLAGDRPS